MDHDENATPQSREPILEQEAAVFNRIGTVQGIPSNAGACIFSIQKLQDMYARWYAGETHTGETCSTGELTQHTSRVTCVIMEPEAYREDTAIWNVYTAVCVEIR